MIEKDDYYQSQKKDAGEDNGGWTNQMKSAFEEFVSDYPTQSKILDVGCFTGRGLEHLKSLGYTNTIGIDLIEENVSTAKERGFDVYQCDMHDLSMFQSNEFDLVFMSHSIEHAIDVEKVLKEVFRIGKNGLIIVPIEENINVKCNPPHYSVFHTDTEFMNTVNNINHTKNVKTKSKARLSKELWFYFYDQSN